jgi:hypothetical protein
MKNFKMKLSAVIPMIVLCLSFSNSANSQCNWHIQFFDGFEYTTPCPDILPGLVYTTVPQSYSVHSGLKSLYLNFVNCTTATGQGACVGDTVYRRTITVCPNVPMRISAWYTTTFSGAQSNIQVTITDGNNAVLKNTPSVIAPYSPMWIQYQSGQFTPTTNTIKLIMITNVAGGNGNDLSMDDVKVEQCNKLNVGSDTTVCNNQVITLNPGIFTSYLWNTGATTPTIQASASTSGNSVKYYFVDVVDSNSCTYRDSIKINFTVCSSVNDVNSENYVQIYPNPAQEQLTLVSKQVRANTYFILSDITGRETDRILINQSTQVLFLSNKSNGVYFYKIMTGNDFINAGKITINSNSNN